MTRTRSTSGLGGEQVEGIRAVTALLLAGRRRVHEVWTAGGAGGHEVEELARQRGVPVRRVEPDALAERARTEAPQGVVARAEAVPAAELDRLLADPAAFVLALDGVTDPQNLGAVLRVADAAGATGVAVPRHRAARITPAVTKAAAGAVEHVPVVAVAGIPAALDRARRAAVWTVGLDATGDTDLFALDVADQPVLLVLGAEGRGLSRLARKRCDVVAAIPMRGGVASLNVGAAAAIACYEVLRRRRIASAARPE